MRNRALSRWALALPCVPGIAVCAAAQTPPPLLPPAVVDALAQEVSGATAKRNLEFITRLHRTRGSSQYLQAAEFVVERLRDAGFADAAVLNIPADGAIFYGAQRSRPAWDVDFAELWEVEPTNAPTPQRIRRLASWDEAPITVAQDSASADVQAELVDVGAGTSEADYEGKGVRGKLVLASQQPGPVARLAVERFGAVGVISYAQNQRTAWWGEDENLIRWGHLDTFATTPTFAFMVSLKEARSLQARLARGERMRFHAIVRARTGPGAYHVATATIPGADPDLRSEEIAFSCHLDHQRPGANDNASGAVTILEVARTLRKLIDEGRIDPPRRTIRFIFPPEVEGTMALLHHTPRLQQRIKAVIHMDMVGGGEATKAIFHITRGPMSLPSFIHDAAAAFARYVNDQTDRFASGQTVAHPLVAIGGSRNPLRAEIVPFTMGSDHDIYQEGSFGIPSAYFNDWPDRYIHTNRDEAANIDATKLQRVAFIGAATGYFLAQATPSDADKTLEVIRAESLRRAAALRERLWALEQASGDVNDIETLERTFLDVEREAIDSLGRFIGVDLHGAANSAVAALASAALGRGSDVPPRPSGADAVYRRAPSPKGPMSTFGYSYLDDKLGADRARALRLRRYQGLWGSGGEYAYEALNLVNGKRTAGDIRDILTAEYGPIPVDIVKEYLDALVQIGALQVQRPKPRTVP